MRMGFYRKLAIEGIRKNKRLYYPYLLTGMVMVMMSYILYFLSSAELLIHMKGGGTLRTLLPIGARVITFFSLVFLLYSSSFLTRQRYKEFGLYQVLGMGKRELRKIVFCESLISGMISITGGLFFGILLSKFAELGMLNLLKEEIGYQFQLDFISAGKVAVLFLGIFLLLCLKSCWKVGKSNPLELLRSAQVGEKAPKARWLIAAVGVIILAYAYYMAVSIKNPLSAVVGFFIAVTLVIVGTYLLFVAGSVVMCRLLQKNKRYYYKANHFVSVSSMTYRMKRNGAGLASICILITMVLVLISSTVSLYAGAEDSIRKLYPKEISMKIPIPDLDSFQKETFEKMKQQVDEIIPEKDNGTEGTGAEIAGLFTEDGFILEDSVTEKMHMSDYERLGYVNLISLEEYNHLMGKNASLKENECFLYCNRLDYKEKTFTIQHCKTKKVKAILDEMYVSTNNQMQVVPYVIMVVKDLPETVEPLVTMKNQWDEQVMRLYWQYAFDMKASEKVILDGFEDLRAEMSRIVPHEEDEGYSYTLNCREYERNVFYGNYAGLFFIGILMSIIFLFAAVLIIYYKQISEGYEDQKRFQVMRNVGMTKQDIRKTINSQVLTVFFSPLLLAGVHLGFAFPIVWNLLNMFNFTNLPLMITVTIISYVIFAIVYALVYKLTSNAYYAIVSGAKES